MSICPSVRLSVKRVNCDKMKETSVHILTPYERPMHLFRHEEWLARDVHPLLPEMLGQTDPTNRNSTKSFSMSLRLISYRLPLSPQKRKVAVFRIKVDLSCKRSMFLVFWHQQRLVQSIFFHLHFGQNWLTLQRSLSAIAELLVWYSRVENGYPNSHDLFCVRNCTNDKQKLIRQL